MKTVIIENDKSLIEDMISALKLRWPDCEYYSTDQGREGIDLADTTSPDLVILGLEVPDINGFEVIKEIRRISTVPLVALSRIKDDPVMIVKALCYGADRFINKPFRMLEFLSRVNALLRRTNGEKVYQYDLDFGKVLSASQSIKEAGQDKEEEQYQEAFSVN